MPASHPVDGSRVKNPPSGNRSCNRLRIHSAPSTPARLSACASAVGGSHGTAQHPQSVVHEGDQPMGKLFYGSQGVAIEFDDRTLAHLQLVLGAKLRRHEAFFCSWRDSADASAGRSSIWIASSIPLYFTFDSGDRPSVNRQWLEELTKSANSPQGLFLTSEPAPLEPARTADPRVATMARA